MRLRLGLLQNTQEIERQAAKEAAEAQAKKHKHIIDGKEVIKDASKDAVEKPKASAKPKIRPLTEAKAIDRGATFLSEAFLFCVAGGLVVFESVRSRRKENSRREDVSERLQELEENERDSRQAMMALEKEVLRLRAEKSAGSSASFRILPKEVWNREGKEKNVESKEAKSWWQNLPWTGDKASEEASTRDREIIIKHIQHEEEVERREAERRALEEGAALAELKKESQTQSVETDKGQSTK
jgi:hypothetical protein